MSSSTLKTHSRNALSLKEKVEVIKQGWPTAQSLRGTF